MKRSWVYMVSVYAAWKTIHEKFMVERNIAVMMAMKQLASCKVKAILKLSMKRQYAQYGEEEKLADNPKLTYKKFNFHLSKTRDQRRARQ